jgi:hypothetical protein
MARAYIYDMVDTWNAGATTFTAIKMNVTDTASAAGSLLMDLQVGGSSKIRITKAGLIDFDAAGSGFLRDTGGGQLRWRIAGSDRGSFGGGVISIFGSGTLQLGDLSDTILTRDAANTLAQRNGVNAQTLRVYNTYTDASNYERVEAGANVSGLGANTFGLMTTRAGTGSSRALYVGTNGASNLWLTTNNTGRWAVDNNGHFLAGADNTYDIGASGANRPRNLYVAGAIFGSNDVRAGAGNFFFFEGRSGITSPSDGVLRLSNAAATDFGRLQFGGTTSSFPAIARNGQSIQLRLADDSGSAGFICGAATLFASTGMSAGGSSSAYVAISTTANFGVYFGSGAPTVSAAKGSLYLRTDGTTTNDRMYVNTNGSTTWTAVTTAA